MPHRHSQPRQQQRYPIRTLAEVLAFSLALVGCGSGSGEPPPPFLLVISVDTLRADHLGAYGNDRQLTPNLDKLAEQSLVFETMYAPASFTVPSVSSLLTGRYPEQNAILTNEHALAPDIPTLTTALASRGYATGAVVSNYVLNSKTGLARDFDRYDERFPQEEAARGLPERKARRTTNDALQMVDDFVAGGESQIFLWVHYQDPHGPYEPPPGYREQLLTDARRRAGDRALPFGEDHRGLDGIPTYQRIEDHDQVAFYLAGYDGEIRFADEEIGRLLGGLEERELLGDAVVVFVADHGEGLGENDYWFAHGEYLTDELVQVPFFLHVPGSDPGRRTDVASLVDIVPTLLPLFGLKPGTDLPGHSLLEPSGESSAYLATLGGSTQKRWGLVADGFKFLVDEEDAQRLYRIGTEDEDVKAEEPDRTRAMWERVKALRKKLTEEGVERMTRQELSDEDRERLKKLGYFGEND